MRRAANPFEPPSVPKTCECKICGQESRIAGLIDASFSGEDVRAGKKVEDYAGAPVYYYRCTACGFTFTRYFDTWEPGDFARYIYNEDYVRFDPDYLGARPRGMAKVLKSNFSDWLDRQSILDYGSGLGLLEKNLREAGVQDIVSYDPFSNNLRPERKFTMITCFEVFEHSPDPVALLQDIKSFLDDGGGLFFSTELCEQEIADKGITAWWYCVPRNGHISFYTRQSLHLLAQRVGLRYRAFNNPWHAMHLPSAKPDWLNKLIPDE